MAGSYLLRSVVVVCLVTAVLCRPRKQSEDYVEYVEDQPNRSKPNSGSVQAVQGAAPTFRGNLKPSETDVSSELYPNEEDDTIEEAGSKHSGVAGLPKGAQTAAPAVTGASVAASSAPPALPAQPQTAAPAVPSAAPTVAPLPTFATLPTFGTFGTFAPFTFPTLPPPGATFPPASDPLKSWIDSICANLSCGRKK